MTAEEAGRARSRDGDSDPPASELPESIEWVVYAPADIVANQLTDMLRAARFDAQLVPDFYRYDPPNPFGVSVIAPPTAVAPLGTFSGGIRARIQSHNVWLGAAKVLGLPGG